MSLPTLNALHFQSTTNSKVKPYQVKWYEDSNVNAHSGFFMDLILQFNTAL